MLTTILVQEEVIKGLLETKEVAVVGVLLAFIALLIYLYIRTDNKLEAANTYIREQDKETLKILGELTNTLKEKKEIDRDVRAGVGKIQDTVADSNTKLTSLNAMIQHKLLGMN